MPRPLSKISADWWDYTTLDPHILNDAARISADDIKGLARDGFSICFYDTLEDFYLAEALEYITSWRQATAGRPARNSRGNQAKPLARRRPIHPCPKNEHVADRAPARSPAALPGGVAR